MRLRIATHVALLVLGALISPIALGFAAPSRLPTLPKSSQPRAIGKADLAAADRLAKVPSTTKDQKVALLKTLGLLVPAGQIGEAFELSPRKPFIDGVTWMGTQLADTSAGKNFALIVPFLGSATLHLVPARDRSHLVECVVDMMGNPWVVEAIVRSKNEIIGQSIVTPFENRISFPIPAQKAVRPIEVTLVAGSLEEMAVNPQTSPRYMLRSCEITPVG
jgi:hypothetical protein